MKYSEAKKQIKALSSKYGIDMHDGDFNVMYKGYNSGIYVDGVCQYTTNVFNPTKFAGMPFSNKLYKILAELAITPLDERVDEKKYHVKVYDGILGYLNINTFTDEMSVDSKSELGDVKTKFTDKEIKQLKQRYDIPLDWNKVTFEEAN